MAPFGIQPEPMAARNKAMLKFNSQVNIFGIQYRTINMSNFCIGTFQ
jgi:hypothetical protein